MYLTSAVNSSVHGYDLIGSYSHSPVWDSVVELFNYCARAEPSKALRADILSLLLPEVFCLYQGYPDDLFFEFVHLLLSSLETPVRHPLPRFHSIVYIVYHIDRNRVRRSIIMSIHLIIFSGPSSPSITQIPS